MATTALPAIAHMSHTMAHHAVPLWHHDARTQHSHKQSTS